MWLPSLLADMKFPPPIIPCQNSSNELNLKFFVTTIVCEISCAIDTLVIGTDPNTYLANSVMCVHVSVELLPELWGVKNSLLPQVNHLRQFIFEWKLFAQCKTFINICNALGVYAHAPMVVIHWCPLRKCFIFQLQPDQTTYPGGSEIM